MGQTTGQEPSRRLPDITNVTKELVTRLEIPQGFAARLPLSAARGSARGDEIRCAIDIMRAITSTRHYLWDG